MVLYIIGNGFDLAHGLKTKYSDFLNYIKDSIVSKVDGRYEYKGTTTRDSRSRIIAQLTNSQGEPDEWIEAGYNNKKEDFELKVCSGQTSFYYNSLFRDFNINNNWADLEEHYYKLILKHKGYIGRVEIINKEFSHLKKLLIDYLRNEVEDKVKFRPNKSIQEYLSRKYYENEPIHFITFNYTGKILSKYINNLKEKGLNIKQDKIHIHGHIYDDNKEIIFGYGDDNSQDYSEIQSIKNNEFLKNFKTFQYLRSARYKGFLSLLGGMDSLIKVRVIGHSCDLSDKTLLKTVFQSKYVNEIEITYHEKEENYFENLYNVSRLFDDSVMMRDKVLPLEKTFMIS